jgi:hypothetical protein
MSLPLPERAVALCSPPVGYHQRMILVGTLIEPAQALSVLAMLLVIGVMALFLWQASLRVNRKAKQEATRARLLNEIPAELRFRVYERDGYTCQRCGRTSDLLVDFVDYHPERGPIRLQSLVTRCTRCAAITRQSGIMR